MSVDGRDGANAVAVSAEYVANRAGSARDGRRFMLFMEWERFVGEQFLLS